MSFIFLDWLQELVWARRLSWKASLGMLPPPCFSRTRPLMRTIHHSYFTFQSINHIVQQQHCLLIISHVFLLLPFFLVPFHIFNTKFHLADAEILSVDSFERSRTDSQATPIIGITLSKVLLLFLLFFYFFLITTFSLLRLLNQCFISLIFMEQLQVLEKH